MPTPADIDQSVATVPPEPIWLRVLAPALRSQARRVWFWLAVGLAIRVALLPLFASVDLLSNAFVTTVLVNQHQLIVTNDPPPIFYIEGALDWLFRPFISSQIGTYFSLGPSFTPSSAPESLAAQTPGINLFVSILKLPFLAADVVIAFVLPRFFGNPRTAYIALLLWWFNPISIYVSYMVGQFDVVATAFLVLAFYYLRSNRDLWCLAAFGLAMFFELYAVVLIPFLLIYWLRTTPFSRKTLQRWGGTFLTTGLAALGLLLILHFQALAYTPANLALSSVGVNGNFGSIVYSRGLTSQPFLAIAFTFLGYSAQLPIDTGLSDVILIVVVAYGVLLILFSRTPGVTWNDMAGVTLASFLVFYALSGFLVQWVLWSMPFLVLLLAKNLRALMLPYVILIIGYFMYTWYFRTVLFGALLQVSYPGASGADPIALMDSAGLPGLMVVNAGRSLFSAACLWFAYLAVRDSIGKVHRAASSA
ncbi:MAG: hypothetical protein WB782_10345 [Thermoplasmata archaeon]